MRTIAPRLLPSLAVLALVTAVLMWLTRLWLLHPPLAGEGLLLAVLAVGALGVQWCWLAGARRISWPMWLRAPMPTRIFTLWTVVGVAGWWVIWVLYGFLGDHVAAARILGAIWLAGCVSGSVWDLAIFESRRQAVIRDRAHLRWLRWVEALERPYAHAETLQDTYDRFEQTTVVRLVGLEVCSSAIIELWYSFRGPVLAAAWSADDICGLRVHELGKPFVDERETFGCSRLPVVPEASPPILLGGEVVRASGIRKLDDNTWGVSLVDLQAAVAYDKVEWRGAGETACLDYSQIEALRDFLSRAWRTSKRQRLPGDDDQPGPGISAPPPSLPSDSMATV